MLKNPRCLYESSIDTFIGIERDTIFGKLCEDYHGDTLTTTREAWLEEIDILQKELLSCKNTNGHIFIGNEVSYKNHTLSV